MDAILTTQPLCEEHSNIVSSEWYPSSGCFSYTVHYAQLTNLIKPIRAKGFELQVLNVDYPLISVKLSDLINICDKLIRKNEKNII